jgi:hypothetical protein
VVLVRRFDPTGEELSRWEVLYRDEDGRPEFFSQTAAKKAALNPPTTGDGADLHIGDLIATMPAEAAGYDEHATGLYVVTPDGVKAAPRPPQRLGGPWLTAWGQDAFDMLRASSAVDRRRLAMVACSCARLACATDDLVHQRRLLETIERWVIGLASLGEVRVARGSVGHSYDDTYSERSDAARAASGASYSAAMVADSSGDDDAVMWAREAVTRSSDRGRRVLAPLVERGIPLPVVLLSRLGYPSAIPFDPSTVPADDAAPRENPRHNRHPSARRRSRR